MRRKIYVGVFLAAVVGVIAGGSLLNRSDAQDSGKKTDEKKASDLFELLKKDLDGKKDTVPPPAVVIPPPKEDFPTIKPLVTAQDKGALPPLPPLGSVEKDKKADAFPPLHIPPVVNQAPPSGPKPAATNEPKELKPMPLPGVPKAEPKDKIILPTALTKPDPIDTKPDVKPLTTFPPIEDKKPGTIDNFPPLVPKSDKPNTIVFPPLEDKKPTPQPSLDKKPMLDKQPDPRFETQGLPKQAFDNKGDPALQAELAKIKNCPWSLQVDVVDGQTIVIATVNKKHEFKIVCLSLDLQTGKGTLKAVGKVQITGDMMTASCDQLAIPLMEDRLMLEGNAAISIQKASTNVSNTKPAAFELKGTTLDLRISDLPGARILQTSMQKAVPLETRQAATAPSDAKKWTGFGKLVRNHAKAGPELRLEKSNGDVIAYIMTNEGKSLEGYVGRTISVLGATEETVGATPVLRVTHIALP